MTESELLMNVWKIFTSAFDPKKYRLFLIGSRAEGSQRPYSDFDFAVTERTKAPLPPAALLRFKEGVDGLKTLYSIDIVDLAGASEDFKAIASRHMKEIVDGKIGSDTPS